MSHEVRVLFKPLDREDQFFKKVPPELKKFTIFAGDCMTLLGRRYSQTKFARHGFVIAVTTGASTIVNFVGSLIKPKLDEMARHSAIMIYGGIYEYNEHGIWRRDCDDAPIFEEHRIVGKSKKTQAEFLEWVREHDQDYTSQTYRASSHNCHHFVRDVCDFLEVPVAAGVQSILNFLENGGESVLDYTEKFIGKCSSSTSISKSNPDTKSSAQSMSAPSKLSRDVGPYTNTV